MHTLEVVGLGILIAFLFALSSWTRAGGLKGKGKSLVRWRVRGEPNHQQTDKGAPVKRSAVWWQWPADAGWSLVVGAVVVVLAVVSLFLFKNSGWPSIILGVGVVYLVFGFIDLIKRRRRERQQNE